MQYLRVYSLIPEFLDAATEALVIQFISSKCMPILFYGLEACSLNKSVRSLDFVLNRFCMKLF